MASPPSARPVGAGTFARIEPSFPWLPKGACLTEASGLAKNREAKPWKGQPTDGDGARLEAGLSETPRVGSTPAPSA